MEQLTTEQEEFRAFCVGQVERLGTYGKEFSFMPAAAVRDYRRWLERRCKSQEQAQAVIDAAVELDSMPTIADLNRLYDSLGILAGVAPKEADPNCPHCAGTGWRLVGITYADYVERCECGVPPASDPTKPAKSSLMSISEIERLRHENHKFAEELTRDLAGKISKSAESTPATQSDIAAILAEQERNRKHPTGCECLTCKPQAVSA